MVDDIIDLQDVLIVHLPQFLIDQLLLGDVLEVSLALLHLSNRDGVVEVGVENAKDLGQQAVPPQTCPYPPATPCASRSPS